MVPMNWVELTGYVASLLVFCTFYMKTMIPLRAVAMASNVAFMTYGLAGGIYPVFVLHVILLPLNCLRLYEVQRLIRQVRAAAHGELSSEWLIPLMTRQHFSRGRCCSGWATRRTRCACCSRARSGSWRSASCWAQQPPRRDWTLHARPAPDGHGGV